MTDWQTLVFKGYRPARIAATFALGAVGSAAGLAAGMPLGALLGAMLVVAVASIARVHLLGDLPGVPQHWRFALVPIVGVAIGASVPPGILDQMVRWWPSVLALLVFVPLAHAISFAIYRKAGRLDLPTSFFAAMPGGFIEALEMGEENRADMPMLVMLQFLRLILCIVFVPLTFALITGHAVGSGSGVEMPGHNVPLTFFDIVVLTAAAVLGYWGGARLGIPAAVITGPLFLSGVAHATGLTAAAPPDWMILVTQWVVGTSLGTRFAGMQPARLRLALGLSVLAILPSMLVAALFGLGLAGMTGEPASAVVLAFAPGGISEMALVAISIKLSAVYVTLHHILRIVLAVLVARAAWSRIAPAGG